MKRAEADEDPRRLEGVGLRMGGGAESGPVERCSNSH
jgi:hypothetical protein